MFFIFRLYAGHQEIQPQLNLPYKLLVSFIIITNLVSPPSIHLLRLSNKITQLVSVTVTRMVSGDNSHVTLLTVARIVSGDTSHVTLLKVAQMVSGDTSHVTLLTVAQMVSGDTSHLTLLMNNSNMSHDTCHVTILCMIQVLTLCHLHIQLMALPYNLRRYRGLVSVGHMVGH